jgi:hypothetical protein
VSNKNSGSSSNAGSSGGSTSTGSNSNPFPVSQDISSPTNLKISVNGGSVNLSWNFASQGSIKPEYYRVRGECIKGGNSCGSYMNDLWTLPGSDGAPMSFQLTQSMLGNPPAGSQWKFFLGAANQTRNVSAAEMSFEPVTL